MALYLFITIRIMYAFVVFLMYATDPAYRIKFTSMHMTYLHKFHRPSCRIFLFRDQICGPTERKVGKHLRIIHSMMFMFPVVIYLCYICTLRLLCGNSELYGLYNEPNIVEDIYIYIYIYIYSH